MTAIFIRIVLYSLWAVVAAEVALFEARNVTWQDPFSELAYVEVLQTVLLAACAALLLLLSRLRPQQAQLALCGMLGFSILFVRENDQVLELFLPHGAWKWLALVLAGGLGWLFFRNRKVIVEQARSLSSSPAFGVYLAALTTLVFSRLIGRRVFWESVMGDHYLRLVKNAAEEGVELFALGLFLAATVEWFLMARRSETRQV